MGKTRRIVQESFRTELPSEKLKLKLELGAIRVRSKGYQIIQAPIVGNSEVGARETNTYNAKVKPILP